MRPGLFSNIEAATGGIQLLVGKIFRGEFDIVLGGELTELLGIGLAKRL